MPRDGQAKTDAWHSSTADRRDIAGSFEVLGRSIIRELYAERDGWTLHSRTGTTDDMQRGTDLIAQSGPTQVWIQIRQRDYTETAVSRGYMQQFTVSHSKPGQDPEKYEWALWCRKQGPDKMLYLWAKGSDVMAWVLLDISEMTSRWETVSRLFKHVDVPGDKSFRWAWIPEVDRACNGNAITASRGIDFKHQQQ